MNKKEFVKSLKLLQSDLVKLSVNTAFNSIGSNVFFEFGQEIEKNVSNGKKELRKEWVIWISMASWRMTRHGKYIGGSGDDRGLIEGNIQRLLGKHFQSIHILSQFLDVEFNFEDGYQLTTFFNWREEDQWTIFLPG